MKIFRLMLVGFVALGIVDYAEQIGLGSKQYELVSLDEELK